MAKTHVSNFFLVCKVAIRARAEGQISNILTQYLSCLAWDRAEIFHLYLIYQKLITLEIFPV